MFFWCQLQPPPKKAVTGETLDETGAKDLESAVKSSAEKRAEVTPKPADKMASKPRRGGWAPNPCPYLGGAPSAGMPSGSGEAATSSFQYQHPSNDYMVDLRVFEGAVECPGCGEPRKQLVRHLKSDENCQKKCVQIDLESFDRQLKAFRQQKSVKSYKSKKKGEDREGFIEKQRDKEQARKGRRKEENKEEFLEKQRNQEQARKGRRKGEDKEEFLEKQRNQQQARKGRRKEDDKEEFLEKQRGQEKARKRRRKDENEEGFLENQRIQEKARKRRRKDENEEGFLEKQRGQKQASRRRRKEKQKGLIGRARKFRRAIMLADIFICSCCERRLFEQNVSAVGDLREKVEVKKAGLFDRCIPVLKEKALVSITINGRKSENHYICHACKGHLLKEKMPPMCAENGLKKEPISDDNHKLTELERNMIALRIPFTKMVMLKKSRYNFVNRTEKMLSDITISTVWCP